MELPFNEYKKHKPVDYQPDNEQYDIETFNYIKQIYGKYFPNNNV